jgi:hypothetical protein
MNHDAPESAGSAPAPPGAPARSETPADALGPAWELLDVLPRSSPSPSLTSTTLEMVAASADAGAWPRGAFRPLPYRMSIIHWLLPAVAVIGALVLGIVLGRFTAPVPARPPGMEWGNRGELIERIERLEQQRDWLERRQRRGPFNGPPPGGPPRPDPRRGPPPFPGEIPPPPR